MINEIIQGSALERLKELENESLDCCITSPPYWALRDYKIEGQLGLEPTFTEYIAKLIQIFNEVKRVLKKTGSCWVNMGDTYNGSKVGNTNGLDSSTLESRVKPQINEITYSKKNISGIAEKPLCLIPQRFQIAMVDQGWICRNTIIWYKPNCMPSSAKDRFTVDFEYLFFFVKNQKYYFDTQYEPIQSNETTGWLKTGRGTAYDNKPLNTDNFVRSTNGINLNPLGRIKRCVWKIPTIAFSDAHFAVFPPELVETPIKATCPEYVCKKCGKAREKIMEPTGNMITEGYGIPRKKENINNWSANSPMLTKERMLYKETGLTSCDCNAGYDGGIVLDPFIGSGTVALVALQNARNFIGIELNPEYIKMAYERLDPYLNQQRITEFADA